MAPSRGRRSMVAERKGRQLRISSVVGLFSGGTQRTALVSRASTSRRVSSGRASKRPVANPKRISVSVLGMAKKPLSSGSVGPAALSGRDAADEGSATESRGGRIACSPSPKKPDVKRLRQT